MKYLCPIFLLALMIPLATGQEEKVEFGKGFKMPDKEVLDAKHASLAKKHGRLMANLPRVSAPSWDSRMQGIIPPVLSQGNCGSCYIFSAAGPATSALIKAAKGKNDGSYRIAEQYGLDCKRNLGGCGGGWPAEVMEELKKNGFPLESEYGPYTARSGQCKGGLKLVKIDDYGYCTAGQESGQATVEEMKTAISKYGEISVALDSSGLTSGNDDRVDTCSGRNIDHAVTFIGWDDNKGPNGAWLMRNSWGKNWANGGYRWVSFKSVIVEALWCYVVTSPSPDPIPPGPGPIPPGPTPDAIIISGGNVLVVEIEKMVIVKEKVQQVSSFPFTLSAPANGFGYTWDVPEGVKWKRKANAIEVTSAPKGALSITVEWTVVDFAAMKTYVKGSTVDFMVGDAPKKPSTMYNISPNRLLTLFGLKLMMAEEFDAPNTLNGSAYFEKKPQTRIKQWTPDIACCGIGPDFAFAGFKLMVQR